MAQFLDECNFKIDFATVATRFFLSFLNKTLHLPVISRSKNIYGRRGI